MAKKSWKFSIELTNGESVAFDNVVNYGFPADGRMFYLEQQPKFNDVVTSSNPGRAMSVAKWFNISEISSIHSNSTVIFSSLKERKEYKNQWEQ